MTAYETPFPLRDEPEVRRRDDRLKVPRLAPLEVTALAIAAIMALGPLSVYAIGWGL